MFPKTGKSAEDLLKQLEANKSEDIPWQSGKTFAFIYDAGDEAMDLVHKAYDCFLTENALDPTAFPSILNMEKEVVGMAADLVNAPDTAEGTFTSGGTESVMLMVKAVRDYTRKHKPEIKTPEIVLPETAHSCFYKACAYFDLKPVSVAVDPDTFLARVSDIEAAINSNTVLLVASAPSYAHGVVDPVTEIAALAQRHNLFCHVDACVGGFYLPFAKKLGYEIPDFDFSVPGVTSISMDLHKFGYAAKGASLIIYREGELKKHQIYACATWTGYSVVNPGITSSRSGGPVAAAWAIMNFLGEEGYKKIVEPTMKASKKVVEGINKIEGLSVLGSPAMNMIAFTCEGFNTFSLMEEMKLKGWYLQAQLAYQCSPENLHITVGASNVPFIDELLQDLEEASARLIKNPPKTDADALPEDILNLLENITPEIFEEVSKMLGAGDGDLPNRMDTVNSLLNQLSAQAREKILIEFVHKLSSI
jgi:glutamate/tyrosine decarboxylase-like PLP-dependent enzyme